ncbi:MAG: hypothetical protein IGS50_10600 [Synechococcales cyanobacterium C42_A2020_086]|jgi:hypothetical protein|nr:hypothetical protein [Synechococcales cyanobacterium M58_A2018_015]MBF2074194.1 hypothetical protein [Synechococcales cyanobacterium C42_A2020_086]
MLTEDLLTQEFITLVNQFYPELQNLLRHCYVKVVSSYGTRIRKRLLYVVLYCPEEILMLVQGQKAAFSDIAHNMGLADVVCINATRLLRDPASTLKQRYPRLWLDLHFMLR